MRKKSIEIAVGFFVLIGFICIGYLTVKFGKMEIISDDTYTLSAKFQSVSGLKTGAQVEMAGVQIGKVSSISLDKERMVADVKMKIRKDLKLTDDVIASVKTSGLIGDKYIKISQGGSDEILENNGEIIETESALDIEDLISKYVFGGV
ncbi:Intermembrane phospholipid transport system binding protein [Desulfonema limicola]|uniref:Intermembrane phospholipid transport system binding protein n=1 Tax=Desulfonema limicola TaxID=45656 RepID=A0A975B5C8_9BACT|nr:outer membrane lipid asymmetry maintenance protein MlaD [Desulfonema limicola]QTA79068.1 Intermembrane phospholipid transport system binding protein [Desulfonema limicola]